ncbi:MAG: thiosulfate oxidation carrier protein SoxY [Burkholderiales bacterium]
MDRRTFLQCAGLTALLAFLARPLSAARPDKAAFEAETLADALKSLNATDAAENKDVVIQTPDVAYDGAAVPVEVTSKIPNTQTITILVDKNPFPLIATYDFANGAEAFVSTRIKMAETSKVRALVNAGGKLYTASREVKVTIGGCGDG